MERKEERKIKKEKINITARIIIKEERYMDGVTEDIEKCMNLIEFQCLQVKQPETE